MTGHLGWEDSEEILDHLAVLHLDSAVFHLDLAVLYLDSPADDLDLVVLALHLDGFDLPTLPSWRSAPSLGPRFPSYPLR